MTRNVWTVAELRAILAALALTSAELPEPQRRTYAQALASVALAVGIRPLEGKAQLTEESLKSGFLTGF